MAKNVIPSAGEWGNIATLLNENFAIGGTLIDTKSEADQNPTGLDTEMLVSHGSTPITANGARYYADGSFSMDEQDAYVVTLDYNVGRDGSSSTAEFYFQAKLAVGIENPQPSDFAFVPDSFKVAIGASAITSNISRTIHFDTSQLPTPVHVQIIAWRDSTGTNDGSLKVATPNYNAAGVTPTPSARLILGLAG